MAINRISHKSVSSKVFDQLKSNIVDGNWKPGDKLPSENELVELMGVSRVSIRDAIQRLVGMGLLTVRRGEGTYVNEMIPTRYFDSLLPILLVERPEYLDVQEYRLMLEPQVAKIAAVKATGEDIEKLRRSVDDLRKYAADKDDLKFGREDNNFHEILAMCSGNGLLVKINRLIGDVMEAVMQQAIIIVGYDGGLKYHDLILRAIEQRDAKQAEAMMYDHIKNNLDVHEGANQRRSSRMQQG